MAWSWFRSRSSAKEDHVGAPEDLRGAPPHARIKTYSAESGYVYQYVFRGYRFTQHPSSKEFVFEVQGSIAASIRVSIQLQEAELQVCSQRIERPLLPAEEYAIAKLALFAGFDEADNRELLHLPLTPDANAMFTHLQTLGRT